jgi:hypothetical protein
MNLLFNNVDEISCNEQNVVVIIIVVVPVIASMRYKEATWYGPKCEDGMNHHIAGREE